MCLDVGKIEPSKCVDHVKAWKTLDEFYCADENLKGMCIKCHNLKTNEDRSELLRKKKIKRMETLSFI